MAKFDLLIKAKTFGTQAIRRLGNSMQGVQGKAKNLAMTMKTVNRSFSGFSKIAIALGGAMTITKIFGDTATLQSQARSLQILTGSLEKSSKIIAELRAFGAVTPFQTTDLINTAKMLKAYGVETENVTDTVKRLSDIAGATGSRVQELALAYGQIQSLGRLQAQDFKQLQQRGVALGQELQKMYKMTGAEFQKAMSDGRISAEAVEVAILRLTEKGGQYFEGAIAQSDTLNGKLSTLKDAFTNLAIEIGNALEPIFKFLLDRTTELLNRLRRGFKGSSWEMQSRQSAAQKTNEKFGRFWNTPFGNQEAKAFFDEQQKADFKALEDAAKGVDSTFKKTADLTIPKLRQSLKDLGDSAKTFADGFESKITQFAAKMNDFGSQVGNAVTKAFQGMEDALVRFVTTGKMAFGDFARSIMADMARIAIRQAIVAPLLNAFTSAISFNSGPAPTGPIADGSKYVPHRALGGPVLGGQSYLVGEQGPELFTPTGNGNISANHSAVMNRYRSNGGTASSEGGVDGVSGSSGGGGVAVVDVRYASEIINQTEYVTASQFQAGIQEAARQGAMRGEQATLRRLQTSPSTRRRVGV